MSVSHEVGLKLSETNSSTTPPDAVSGSLMGSVPLPSLKRTPKR